jgi:hypothetical protein
MTLTVIESNTREYKKHRTNEKLVYLSEQYRKDHTRSTEIKDFFIPVTSKGFYILSQAGKAQKLYGYMFEYITGKSKIKDWWGKTIVPYFMDGYLPFAQHQDYITEKLGLDKKKRYLISRWFTKLEQLNLIMPLDTVHYRNTETMQVWSLGINIQRITPNGIEIPRYVTYLEMLADELDEPF